MKYKPTPDCSCEECQDGCKRRPGWFWPGETLKVAEYLNITPRDLYQRYLVMDYWTGNARDIFVPWPGSTEEHGQVASFGFAFGARCIFYNGGRCQIHPVKPKECRVAGHDNLRGAHSWIAMRWKKSDPWKELEIEEVL